MDAVIGIDGGGTRTRVLCAGTDGAVLARSAAKGSNPQHISAQELAGVLAAVIAPLLIKAKIHKTDVVHVAAGFAGAGRETDRKKVRKAFEEIGFGGRCSVYTDSEIALEGALPGGDGMIVVAGTGSSVFGRNAAGEVARAGGYGYLLGDEGSGWSVGIGGMKAALEAADGMRPETALTDAVKEFFGLSDVRDVISRLYAGDISRESAAAFAPEVLACAEWDDSAAVEIVWHEAEQLARQVCAAINRLKLDVPATVCCAGSVLEKSGLMRRLLEVELEGHAALEKPALSPVAGAAILALKKSGVPTNKEVRRNLGTLTDIEEEAL